MLTLAIFTVLLVLLMIDVPIAVAIGLTAMGTSMTSSTKRTEKISNVNMVSLLRQILKRLPARYLLFLSTSSMKRLKLSGPTLALTFSQAGPMAAFHGARSGREITMPLASRSLS